MPPEIYINSELVADLPDKDGVYNTPVGVIGVTLTALDNMGRGIILDCRDAKPLQGARGRKERSIGLNKYGIGKAQLSKTETLEVRLQGAEKPTSNKTWYVKEVYHGVKHLDGSQSRHAQWIRKVPPRM